ncbi:DUF1697 domain-containing protein [Halocynthiibacter sp. C4]|uniref:DUF1697 domain-containing protein n=1 Tax=Halocynthiibacter sp. C4 TaxID=2992758 RepID=UPI00237C28DB|nr:DUF1697 domain-containing protein [Halocynthiibacter sp. C4]MDE0589853.1 DUF1697 domain-containing protein [Halocynthiibacter sp. C4]
MSINKWIVLLRGINVGGHNKLPMKPLCAAMAKSGFHDPKSYIQSGNLTFSTHEESAAYVTSRLATLIETEFELTPEILILTVAELQSTRAACPFSTDVDPKTLHFLFLAAEPPAPDLAKIESLRAEDEQFAIIDRCAYLLAPSGIGRSKLMAAAERLFGVPTTARNLRSVEAILALAAA